MPIDEVKPGPSGSKGIRRVAPKRIGGAGGFQGRKPLGEQNRVALPVKGLIKPGGIVNKGVDGPTFTELGVSRVLVETLGRLGFTWALPVQAQSIPVLSEGKDLVMQAPTGTGKTLAYLLPLMERVEWDKPELQLLVMAPSQELAMQIRKVAEELAPDKAHVLPLVGAAAMGRQLEQLKRKPRVAVGTPGRLRELVDIKKLRVHGVKALVIDEADKMLGSGFGGDVSGVRKACLRDTQVVLVSATSTPELEGAVERLMHSPERLALAGKGKAPENLRHVSITTKERDKVLNVKRILGLYDPPRALVFIERNEAVQKLVHHLGDFGIEAQGLHSDLPDVVRKEVIEGFRSGKPKVLVTTDIFARGLDIEGLDIVINWDLPKDDLKYVHRAGRAGRAGRSGMCISLVTEEERRIPRKFEKRLGIKIEKCYLAHGGLAPLRDEGPRG